MAIVEVKVFYLEMTSHAQRSVPAPCEGLSILQAKSPTVGYYRFLYDAVGSDYHWHSRKKLSDAELADFLGAVGQALADPPLQAALVRLTSTLMAGNRRGYAALADSSALRDHAKRIKEHTLAHLDRYLEQLEGSVRGLGGHVYWADTAE